MKQNKILGAAILAALAGGSGVAQAATEGKLELVAPSTTAYTIAKELFDENDSVSKKIGPFTVEYAMPKALPDEFDVTFTLDTGRWTKDANNVYEMASSNLQMTSPTAPAISINDVQDQTVTFLVQADKTQQAKKGDVLKFQNFKLDGLGSALYDGGSVKLTINIQVNNQAFDNESLIILNSAQGVEAIIKAPKSGNTQIDVATSALHFVNGITEKSALLGTLEIKKKGSPYNSDGNGFTSWEVTSGLGKASFQIDPGPFAASQSHDANSGDDSKKLIFIDSSSSACSFDKDKDIPAKQVASETTAQWEISNDDLKDHIVGKTNGICVLVPDGNNTPINETTDVPIGLLTLQYGNNNVSFKGRLLHIKRNGTVCTLYNVPNVNAIDIANIRVTNRSSQAGSLVGSLRDQNNDYIFQNAKLLGEATIDPNATVRLTAEDLKKVATDNGHATGDWAGRAVLTISSDLTNMEVFGLLRNKAGGPLLNMSTGASGDGCD